jgi:ectoine hydroxylase-related dioxygenase (phytanoyl-CoA dioxygenase family)
MNQPRPALLPALPATACADYARDGVVHLTGLADPGLLARVRPAIDAAAEELGRTLPPLAERGTYGRAFRQCENLWRRSEAVHPLVFDKTLARTAAALMDCRAVRIYHDQALYKEPGGGHTPWHVDQHYWPLATERTITAWIPLVEVPAEMGPLEFALGSHRATFGRQLEISDESEEFARRTLNDYPHQARPYRLGDVSFHAGWTWHRSGPNRTSAMRAVMTVIYFDADALVAEPANDDQRRDLASWLPGCRPGGPAASPLNPVIE